MMCADDDKASCCGVCNYKVVACIPVFGRLPLLKHTIERLYKKNGVYKVICVGELSDDKKLCESLGAEWITYPNYPLGAKWNRAFKEAKKYNPDSVLFVGSSDWISDNWLKEMRPLAERYDIIGTAGCHFLHLSKPNLLCYWPGYVGNRAGESIGIGRLISSKLLDRLQWEPFSNHLNASLDHSMIERCRQQAGSIHLASNYKIKSVSISTDLWPNKHAFTDHYHNRLPSQKIQNVEEWINENFPEASKVFADASMLH